MRIELTNMQKQILEFAATVPQRKQIHIRDIVAELYPTAAYEADRKLYQSGYASVSRAVRVLETHGLIERKSEWNQARTTWRRTQFNGIESGGKWRHVTITRRGWRWLRREQIRQAKAMAG